MKKSIIIITAFLFSFTAIEPSTWELDKAHAKLGFTVTHLMISEVDGWFKTFDATVTASKEDFSDAVAEMTADVSSINTENEKRDKDLRSANFFDVEKYPAMTFKSTLFKKAAENKYKVTGSLTMHGITKPIELDAMYRMTNDPMTQKPRAGFRITGKINRSDFKIGAATPAAVVSQEVSVVANAEFVKKVHSVQ